MERAIADYQKTGDFEALGYLTKKELYKRTGDTKFLQRTPSFNDPAVLENLADIVRASARNKARYNMDYYFVGDEGSLTSYGDAVDFEHRGHRARVLVQAKRQRNFVRYVAGSQFSETTGL
jgi:hypothetical protein